jgi:AcrR family transcriptional regulator
MVARAGARSPEGRERRRQAVLDVADRMFSERGYHEVSLDEVAAGAAISKPGLYAYFGSKEGLYVAALRRAAEGLAERVEAAVVAADTPERRMWAGIQAMVGFIDENRAAWTMLHRERVAGGERYVEEVERAHDRIAALITELSAQTAAARGIGGSALEASEPLGHAFVGMCESIASWWLDHPEVPRGTVAMHLMNLAWMGFGDLTEGRMWFPEAGT